MADDYQRQGGHLSGDHVLRAVEKRLLDQEDDAQIRQQLHELGIEIDDPESAVDFEHLDGNARRSDGLLGRYLLEIGSTQPLKPQDEIVLARAFALATSQRRGLDQGITVKITASALRKRVCEGT